MRNGIQLDYCFEKIMHPRFDGDAGYTIELSCNLIRRIRTRTLHPRSLTFCVAVGLVPEMPLSLSVSATMRTPYSETKANATVDKWMPKTEAAEEQEEEEDGVWVWVASSQASGMSAGCTLLFFFFLFF